MLPTARGHPEAVDQHDGVGLHRFHPVLLEQGEQLGAELIRVGAGDALLPAPSLGLPAPRSSLVPSDIGAKEG
jgi:hypothetical protein